MDCGAFLFEAFVFMPGIGPVLVAGPLVAWIVGALEGAVVVGGLSVLGAALASLGIPENSALKYESELRAGKFLLFVHGTREEIARARAVLELTQHEGVTEQSAG